MVPWRRPKEAEQWPGEAVEMLGVLSWLPPGAALKGLRSKGAAARRRKTPEKRVVPSCLPPEAQEAQLAREARGAPNCRTTLWKLLRCCPLQGPPPVAAGV